MPIRDLRSIAATLIVFTALLFPACGDAATLMAPKGRNLRVAFVITEGATMIDFAGPYANSPNGYLVAKNSDLAKMPGTGEAYNLTSQQAQAEKAIEATKPLLKGKTIGVQGSTIHSNFADKYLKGGHGGLVGFEIKGGAASRQRRFDVLLRAIGREGEITSKARESAHSMGRLLTLLVHSANDRKEAKHLQARIRTAARDVASLTDHATFLSGKIIFLLDATLGMVSIQQNDIIKIFSVAAVVFLPPTLIASIYGMNFKWMPELEWTHGYPFALVMMLIAAIVPYWIFKWKKWL